MGVSVMGKVTHAADDDEYYEDYDHGKEMQDEPHQYESDHSVRSYIYGDGKQQ